MRPQYQVGSLPLANGLAGLMMAAPIQCTYARGRGGGFAHGGFSREGPAAAGGFASRSGSMAGRERGLESGARGAEASRMEQANRMEQAAHEYHRAYPYAGAAAAAAAAPAVAAAASAPAAYGGTQPCANAVSVPVGPFTFFRCGTAWYRQAYGPAGPTFVQVERPGLE